MFCVKGRGEYNSRAHSATQSTHKHTHLCERRARRLDALLQLGEALGRHRLLGGRAALRLLGGALPLLRVHRRLLLRRLQVPADRPCFFFVVCFVCTFVLCVCVCVRAAWCG
jgi:hypothetical protein